jgi:hypothetical protein
MWLVCGVVDEPLHLLRGDTVIPFSVLGLQFKSELSSATLQFLLNRLIDSGKNLGD